MSTEIQFRVPAFAELSEARLALERLAPGLQALSAGEHSEVVDSLFEGLEFPELTKLELLPGYRLEGAKPIFERFPRLRQLRYWTRTHEQNEATFPALAAAPWWDRLTHLDLQFLFRSAERLQETGSWAELWAGRELSFELMKATNLSLESVDALLEARFPRLRYLSVSTLPDALLPLLANAELPALE